MVRGPTKPHRSSLSVAVDPAAPRHDNQNHAAAQDGAAGQVLQLAPLSDTSATPTLTPVGSRDVTPLSTPPGTPIGVAVSNEKKLDTTMAKSKTDRKPKPGSPVGHSEEADNKDDEDDDNDDAGSDLSDSDEEYEEGPPECHGPCYFMTIGYKKWKRLQRRYPILNPITTFANRSLFAFDVVSDVLVMVDLFTSGNENFGIFILLSVMAPYFTAWFLLVKPFLKLMGNRWDFLHVAPLADPEDQKEEAPKVKKKTSKGPGSKYKVPLGTGAKSSSRDGRGPHKPLTNNTENSAPAAAAASSNGTHEKRPLTGGNMHSSDLALEPIGQSGEDKDKDKDKEQSHEVAGAVPSSLSCLSSCSCWCIDTWKGMTDRDRYLFWYAILWVVGGVPFLVCVDIALVTRYLINDLSNTRQMYYYSRMRVLLESVCESLPQLCLQFYLYRRSQEASADDNLKVNEGRLAISVLASLLSLLKNVFLLYYSAKVTGRTTYQFAKILLQAGMGITPFVEAITKGQIKKVSYKGMFLADDEYEDIARAIRSPACQLNSIVLPNGAKYTRDKFKGEKAKQGLKLNLARQKMSPQQAQIIFALLGLWSKGEPITTLDFRTNRLYDKGAMACAEFLRHNTTVRHLILKGNGITVVGAHALGTALVHHNTTLQTLTLNASIPVADLRPHREHVHVHTHTKASGSATSIVSILSVAPATTSGTSPPRGKEEKANGNGKEEEKHADAAAAGKKTHLALRLDLHAAKADTLAVGAVASPSSSRSAKLSPHGTSPGGSSVSRGGNSARRGSRAATPSPRSANSNTHTPAFSAVANTIAHLAEAKPAHVAPHDSAHDHSNAPKSAVLTRKGYKDIDVVVIAALLKHNHNVTSLNLSRNDFGDDGAEALAAMLEHNSTITKVDLMSNNIKHKGGVALGAALAVNTAIHTLILSENEMSAEAAAEIFRAVAKPHPTLHTLKMRFCRIGDPGAMELAKVAKANQTVKHIDIHGMRITDKMMDKISMSLKNNVDMTIAM